MELARAVSVEASRIPEVMAVAAFVGTPSPIDFNGMVRRYYQRFGGNMADLRITLIDKVERGPMLREVRGNGTLVPEYQRLVAALTAGRVEQVLARIDPAKDVDGFHPVNVGRLVRGEPAFVPCTPLGCLMLLKDHLGDLSGKNAVVIGRSNIVGKPMAQLLLAENCTVTIAHSRTQDLPDVVRRADIVVAAVGRAEMVTGDWLKAGAVVIDVGINRLEPEAGQSKGRLVGDVAFDDALARAGAITPVPGGVGPMTIACLLRNTLVAAYRRAGMSAPEGI